MSDRARIEQLSNKLKAISPQFYDFAQSQIAKYKTPEEQQRLQSIVQGWQQSGLIRLADFTASILDLLLIPFFVYYFLAEYGAMRAQIDRLIPPRYRSVTSSLIIKINFVFSSYVRSQLLIALAMGLMYSLGFALFSVPLALTLGLFSGLLNFVPYLGTLTGLTLSLSFVALDNAGPGRLIGVLLVFVIVQSIEGYYLTPKLLGGSLHLHPLWVLTGLMVGGNLFGLLGIILAVPAIAISKVVLEFLRGIYEQSNFYRRAGLNLLTDQGEPVDLLTSPEAKNLIIEEAYPSRPRRAVITTGELKSRIRDEQVIVNEEDR
jgi:predicted PurR-regulated permease PerM